MLVVPSGEGLKISASLNQVSQRHVYIPRSLFTSWSQDGPTDRTEGGDVPLHFCVPLEHLIEAIELCSVGLSDAPRAGQGIAKAGAVQLCWKENVSRLSVRYDLGSGP